MRHTRRGFLAAAAAATTAMPLLAWAGGGITPARFSNAAALGIINDARRRRHRQSLVLNDTLQGMATSQARRLAALKRMTHSPDGQRLTERAASAGYTGFIAENLADGYETFEEAVDAWIASGDHRVTMFRERYTRFGAAVAVAEDAVPGDWGIYWVTLYGT